MNQLQLEVIQFYLSFQILAKVTWTLPLMDKISLLSTKFILWGQKIHIYKFSFCSSLSCLSVLQKFYLHLRDFLKSNLNHMELAVSSIYLSHHMKYHQPVQYLAGKSKQDMDNVSSQKETLDSTVCFLQRRTSVCKPRNSQLSWKKVWISCWGWQPHCLYHYVYIYEHLDSWEHDQLCLYCILELHNSWHFLSFIISLLKIWIS